MFGRNTVSLGFVAVLVALAGCGGSDNNTDAGGGGGDTGTSGATDTGTSGGNDASSSGGNDAAASGGNDAGSSGSADGGGSTTAACLGHTMTFGTCAAPRAQTVNATGVTTVAGTTAGGACGTIELDCGGSPSATSPLGPQDVLSFTVPGSGMQSWTFSLDNPGTTADFDTVMEVRVANCTMDADAVCDDDSGSSEMRGFTSIVERELMGGTTVYVIVSGYPTTSRINEGTYELTIQPTPAEADGGV